MPAACKCTNGHVFSSRIIEDSPDINCIEVKDGECPDCGADFEITGIDDNDSSIYEV